MIDGVASEQGRLRNDLIKEALNAYLSSPQTERGIATACTPTISPVCLWRGRRYAALAQGRVHTSALHHLLSHYPLADAQPIYAVHCSVWARCAAQTRPERGYDDYFCSTMPLE